MMLSMSPADLPERNKACAALGKSLKALRIDANKSQEQLAFEAEVDRTFISAIERGIANPSILTLAHLCYALGITLADLFASVKVSAPPSDGRRSNNAQPAPRAPKSRLR